VQPYRLTLLHPHHQGFWWLAVEPPILVALAGLFFGRVVARPLIADLEERERGARAEFVHWLFATGVLMLG